MSDSKNWLQFKSEEILPILQQKISAYYMHLETVGLLSKVQRVYKMYHGISPRSPHGIHFANDDIKRTGSNGQLIQFNSNHMRNIIDHSHNLITNQRPAGDVKCVNSDYKSQQQGILGKSLLDYYMRHKNCEAFLKRAVLNSILFAEGWMTVEWDTNAGEDYSTEDIENQDPLAPVQQKIIKEGDVVFGCPTILDVVRDIGKKDANHHWLGLRRYRNKFILAQENPQKAAQIMDAETQSEHKIFGSSTVNQEETDEIAEWTFYIKPSQSNPAGRKIRFLYPDILLEDIQLPYSEIPCYQILPSQIEGMPFGYSPAFDLVPLQETVDVLTSAIISNQRAYATQNIWVRKGSGISPSQLQDGLNLISSDEKPEVLQLCNTAPEVFNFRQQLIQDMEQIMGINSVIRGQPEASLKSGAALALVVSQAVQFMNNLSQQYNALFEAVGTGMLVLLRDYAKTKRVAAVVGESSRGLLSGFTGDDLSSINRVIVEQANPLTKTLAGRMELLNQLVTAGAVKDPRAIIQLINTGNLDACIEDTSHEILLGRAENESLRNGEDVQALLIDDHQYHIDQHKRLIADPLARQDPNLVQRVLGHINEHIELWRAMPVDLVQALGRTPAPQPAPTQSPQGQPQQFPEPQPNQPNMPKLPPNSPQQAQQAYEQGQNNDR